MLNVSQNWKEKMGCYLMSNRDRLTPEELIKLEYNIDGQTLVLNKSDIINFTHTQNCDLNSLTLPKNEIQFEIDNSDGRWNPDNPTGLYQKITEKQKVDLYYGVMINGVAEWHKAGTFYMSGWDTPQNGLTATFTATSQLDFGKDKFGEQTYTEAPTYKDVCETAFSNMGLSAAQYSIDESLDDYEVPTPTPATKHKYQKWNYITTYTFARQDNIRAPIGTTHMCDGNTYVVSANNWTTDYTTGEFVGTIVESSTDKLQLSSSNGFFTSATGTIGDTVRTPYRYSYPYVDQYERYMDKNGNIINQSAGSFSLSKFYFTESQAKGETHIEDVLVDSQCYPTDGYQDGYWWVYVGEVSVYTAELFNNTTDSAVIQYCANAAQCRIRYDVNGKIYIEPFNTEAELTDYVIDQFVSYKNAEYEMSKPIKNVLINSDYVVELSQNGENQQISNPLITSQLQANLYAGWLGRVINTRKEISGEWRSDMRLQPYDYIKVMNKYAVNEAFITGITYTFSGCFRGTYEGRVMKSINSTDLYGNYYAGDHNKANSTIS